MVFITTGTWKSFHRLIKHLDKIAPQLEEKMIAQIGHSLYVPQNMIYERFYPSLNAFIDDSRLVISHGGFSTIEIIEAKKPCIIVPRQKKFDEHFDDHQVEFAELLYKKYKIPFFIDLGKLTKNVIMNHKYKPEYDLGSLLSFKNTIQEII